MSRKVTVIGAGNVGATIAYTLSLGDIASQIVVVDINRDGHRSGNQLPRADLRHCR